MSNDLTLWVKYRKLLGGEQWSDQGAVSHAVKWGRTLCGVTVRSIKTGWAIDNYGRWDASGVTCKRCLKALSK